MPIISEHIAYRDPDFYSAFTSMVCSRSGKLIIVFRRAPRRKPYSSHHDSQSTAALIESNDGGISWSAPRVYWLQDGNVGIQDPSITELQNGDLISNAFKWQIVKEEPFNHTVLGTYTTRSKDMGKTWQPDKIVVADFPNEFIATSEPVIELSGDNLLLPVYDKRGCFCLRSRDNGATWGEPVRIGDDPLGNVWFCEPSLCLTGSGKIIAMLRLSGNYLYQSESLDGGLSWSVPAKTVMWGYPAHLLRLRDNRILCSYGYRRIPFGVRACISEDEGKTWNIRQELVIRNDGQNEDLGYPASAELRDGTICTSYYFNDSDDGIRYIGISKYTI